MHLGEEGYKRHAEQILETTKAIAEGVRNIAGLKVLGDVAAMIVCFASDEMNIYRVVSLFLFCVLLC